MISPMISQCLIFCNLKILNQNVKIFQVKSQIYAGQLFSLFRSRPFLQSTLQSASNQLTTGGQKYFLALHIFPR